MTFPVAITGITQDTGSSASDGITADNRLVINGTAAVASSVTVKDGAATLGTVLTDGTGHWSFNYAETALSDGNHSLTAKVGVNTSDAFVATIDTAIAAPTLDSITTDTNVIGDFVTSDNTVSLHGTAEANSVVEAFFNNVSVGSSTADGSGSYTINVDPEPDGTYAVKILATDVAGNNRGSTIGAFPDIVIDSAAPGQPSVNVGLSDDSGTGGDSITNDNTPTFTGSAEANSTVTVYIDGDPVGTTTANGSGFWSFETDPLSDDLHGVNVTATDLAGNTSIFSATNGFAIDTTIDTPSVDFITNDTGPSDSDGVTSDMTLVINGTAEANSTVEVFQDDVSIGTVTASGGGSWSINTGSLDLHHEFTAQATDVAGNVSSVSDVFDVTVDTNAPAAPTLTSIEDDTGSSSTDEITSDTSPTITGTAEQEGTLVTIFDGASQIGTANAGEGGIWSFTTDPLLDGSHSITATATDLAGNTSFASAPFPVIVDTSDPSTPTDSNAGVNTVAENVINGATVGVTASSTDANGVVYSLSDDAGGRFAINSSTGVVTVADASLINFESDTSHNITVVATDVAGNTSSDDFTIAVTDINPPTPVDTNGGTGGSVAEGAATGTLVGITAFSDDVHGGPIDYSLTDNAGGAFQINSSTGVVTVLNGLLLDFESSTSANITVQADDGFAQATQTFAIGITNVDGQTINGTSGNDTIDATHTPAGQPFPTNEGDTIFGNKGNDTITALAGNDIIDGGAGTDVMHGGDGNDTFVVTGLTNYATDHFFGDAGAGDAMHVIGTTDVVLGGFDATASSIEIWNGNAHGLIGTSAIETFDLTGLTSITGLAFVDGGAGNDTLIGSDLVSNDLRGGIGTDTLNGGDLADTLTGGAGGDNMFGGDGNDTYVIAKSDGVGDTIIDGTGTDTLQATGKVTLSGFDAGYSSIEQWVGLAGNSVTGTTAGETFDFSALTSMTGLASVDGSKGDDTLIGSNFVDHLLGGDGNDVLNTNAGNDFMTGGKGFDDFHANTGDGVDTVTDYKGGQDQFFVERAGFNTYGEVQAAMTQINNNHDVQIDFGGGDMLIIQHTTIAFLTVHQADFVFV